MSLPTCFSSDSANVMFDLVDRLLGRDIVQSERDIVCCALARLATQQEHGLDRLRLKDIALKKLSESDLHPLPGDPNDYPEEDTEEDTDEDSDEGSEDQGGLFLGIGDLEQVLRNNGAGLIALDPCEADPELPFVLENQELFTRKNYLARKAVLGGFPDRCDNADPELEGGESDFAALSEEELDNLWNRGVTILAGGTHSGKETLAARYVLHGLNRDPQAIIRIVAPTHADGRRFDADFKETVSQRGFPGRACYPKAMTVHRALGLRPDGSRSGKTPPIAMASCVVVLAAHRIDLPIFATLMESVPQGAKLLLVGDPEQTMGGQLGQIFSELVKDCHCCMKGRVHHALEEQERDCGGAPASLRFWDGHPTVGNFFPAVRERWAAFLAARTPGEALEHRDDFHVLCEGPDGDFGAAAFNAYLQELLPAKAPRLCKVNADDALLGISHGDIAVQMPRDPEHFWLPSIDGGAPRSFATALLPSLEPAWALTVKEAAEHSFKSCFAMLRQDGNIDEETLYAAKDCCRDSFQLWRL